MQGAYRFIVKPKFDRHESKKQVGDKELILNTELQNHQYVSRLGVVVATPVKNYTNVKQGDEVIVHHNVFRRFYDVRGQEKDSASYYKDDLYFVQIDQIFAYKSNNNWTPLQGFNFVAPIKNNDKLSIDKEQPLKGILRYVDPDLKQVNKNDIIGFNPGSEYEFIIDKEKLYRVSTNSITIKYERKGHEEQYNPSWA